MTSGPHHSVLQAGVSDAAAVRGQDPRDTVSTQQASKFMSGTSLSGSEVYARSNVLYFKTKMSLHNCYEERAKIVSIKWVMPKRFLTFGLISVFLLKCSDTLSLQVDCM